MTIAVLGMNLGNNSCSVVGLDATARRVAPTYAERARDRFQRKAVMVRRGYGSLLWRHHLDRAPAERGHTVRLMSPEHVRHYIKAHKNDDHDA